MFVLLHVNMILSYHRWKVICEDFLYLTNSSSIKDIFFFNYTDYIGWFVTDESERMWTELPLVKPWKTSTRRAYPIKFWTHDSQIWSTSANHLTAMLSLGTFSTNFQHRSCVSDVPCVLLVQGEHLLQRPERSDCPLAVVIAMEVNNLSRWWTLVKKNSDRRENISFSFSFIPVFKIPPCRDSTWTCNILGQ